jgi:hypothetical protein
MLSHKRAIKDTVKHGKNIVIHQLDEENGRTEVQDGRKWKVPWFHSGETLEGLEYCGFNPIFGFLIVNDG